MSLLEIQLPPERDRDNRKLHELLEAVRQVERLGALRALAIHTLAFLGAILWIGVAFPGHLPETLGRSAVALFAAVALATVVLVIRERYWHHVQERYIDGRDVRVVDDRER